MINKHIDAISLRLNSVFGDEYDIYTHEIEQGFKEPCFFIMCVDASKDLFLGPRYFRSINFCVYYFPLGDEESYECHRVAEELYRCLEWLELDGNIIRGTHLKHDIVDGVLNFKVSYNSFEVNLMEVIPMGALLQDIIGGGGHSKKS